MTEKIDKPRKEDSACDIGRVFATKIVLLMLEECLLKDGASGIGRVFTCTLKIVLVILEEYLFTLKSASDIGRVYSEDSADYIGRVFTLTIVLVKLEEYLL